MLDHWSYEPCGVFSRQKEMAGEQDSRICQTHLKQTMVNMQEATKQSITKSSFDWPGKANYDPSLPRILETV